MLRVTVPAHRPVNRSALSAVFKPAQLDIEPFLDPV